MQVSPGLSIPPILTIHTTGISKVLQQWILYFTKMIFLYYTSTQSQTFEHFENTLCSNLGLMVSLLHLSLQLFGWYPVFVGFGGFLSVGLGFFESLNQQNKSVKNISMANF